MGSKTEKRQLKIFIGIAYGIPYLLGLLMWYGSMKQMDLSAFPVTQMLYPAMGVMFAFLLTRREDKEMPRAFYICFILMTALSIVCTALSVLLPDVVITTDYGSVSVFCMAVQYILAAGGLICLICLIAAGKKKREAYGVKGKNWMASVGCVVLFVVLYFFRVAAYNGLSGQLENFISVMLSAEAWIYLAIMPLNFLLGYAAFFGEEYGWRYYLQPFLQKKFGLRKGVLILGVVWGLWHLPVNFFYYSPGTGLISAVGQQITCITLGIFFAYAYMKTENIWVPVVMHYINNNMAAVVGGGASAIENNVYRWVDVPVLIGLNMIFMVFIYSKVYREKKENVQQDI